MRHQLSHRKLGRTTSHRLAMLRNMVFSLVKHEKIETTLPKAKELRCLADRIITIGKRNTLVARRQVFDVLRSKDAVGKVFSKLAPRFMARQGGYTRIYKLGYRLGDSAPMAVIEYLPEDLVPEEKKKASKKKKKSVE